MTALADCKRMESVRANCTQRVVLAGVLPAGWRLSERRRVEERNMHEAKD